MQQLTENLEKEKRKSYRNIKWGLYVADQSISELVDVSNVQLMAWREDLVFNGISCFCRGPRFGSKHPHSVLQPSASTDPRCNPMFSSGLCEHQTCMWCINIYVVKHSYIYKIGIKYILTITENPDFSILEDGRQFSLRICISIERNYFSLLSVICSLQRYKIAPIEFKF